MSLYSTIILPVILNLCGFWSSNSDEPNNFSLAVYPPMAFGISIINFTMNLIQDRATKCKHVAISQGLPVRSYWLGNFVVHYLLALPTSVVLLIMIVVRQPLFLYGPALPLICCEALVYPVSLILWSYNFSLLFDVPEIALKILPLSNMLLAVIPAVAVQLLFTVSTDLRGVAQALHVVMSFVNPVYMMPGMIIAICTLSADGTLQSTMDYFTSLCAIPLYGTLFVSVVLALNVVYQDLKSYSTPPGAICSVGQSRKDEDVIAEEHRVEETAASPPAEEALRYQNLVHTYKTKTDRKCGCCGGTWTENQAVRGISLAVQKGECFGLLGPNGAGKTTTLAVLTGEVRPPTSGKVTIFDSDLSTSSGLTAAYQVLGVCPQVDPLWESISGREHLIFYGRIKGVPEEELSVKVDGLLRRLGFDQADANKNAGTYSGGMKRKLSLGIALIGHSPVLFLDEPSAAVDAGAKRHLWKIIKMRGPDQTVVLTTHSMEEAEALCERIAIQVQGQLRCLGSPTHIKNTYGSGYQIEIFKQSGTSSQSSQDPGEMTAFLHARLSPEVHLLEAHAGRYLYQLPPMHRSSQSENPLTLGKVFTELQAHSQDLGIMEYSLSQPSLEQVFIRFAREQHEPSVSLQSS